MFLSKNHINLILIECPQTDLRLNIRKCLCFYCFSVCQSQNFIKVDLKALF